MPLEQAFQFCRDGMNRLSEMERFDVWHHARKNRDRLAGILCVAEFRMPSLPVLGEMILTNGDTLSDYDRARTFILQNRESGQFIPNFYPEVANLPARARVISLAQAHINCTPKGQRQTNLFSVCGYNKWQYANDTTTPYGTTCALFMRAILKAAGDSRLTATEDMLPREQTDMYKAMGINLDIATAGVAPFCSALRLKGKLPTPQRGDLYHTIIPTVAWGRKPKKQDSGHVGFITSASRTGDNIFELQTIDGGINKFFTAADRLVLVRDNAGNWEASNRGKIEDEKRILVGFVDLDQVAGCFLRENNYSLEGRFIDAQYTG